MAKSTVARYGATKCSGNEQLFHLSLNLDGVPLMSDCLPQRSPFEFGGHMGT